MVVDNGVTTARLDAWCGQDSAPMREGLIFNGRKIRNVYPYDAAGRPLLGAQLVDENGRRLGVDGRSFEWGSPRAVSWRNVGPRRGTSSRSRSSRLGPATADRREWHRSSLRRTTSCPG